MPNPFSKLANEANKLSGLLHIVFIVVGVLFIVVSLNIPADACSGYWRELLKELGIVLLAVFSVSLGYEKYIAGTHFLHFYDQLKLLVQKGESNAAMCARLGIEAIYPTRDALESERPLSAQIESLPGDATVLIIGRTLAIMMTKTVEIQRALERGVHIKLCILNPTLPREILRKTPSLILEDITGAISAFRTFVAIWVDANKPKGSIILKYHSIPLLDSLLMITSSTQTSCVWDLSFGRDQASKRVFVFGEESSLGRDLIERYDYVWKNAETVFEYDKNNISVDSISKPKRRRGGTK